MSTSISDEKFRALLSGNLTDTEEQLLEKAIETDGELRRRWETISGAEAWPLGSAPVPVRLESKQLDLAIQIVHQSLEFAMMRSPKQEIIGKSDEPVGFISSDSILQLKLPGIRLLREMGRGGMGVVVEGIDESLDRRVAVKFLHPLRASDPSARERMTREAQAVAALQHENILAIYSYQVFDNIPLLVQQFIDGESLQDRLSRDGKLPLEVCIDIARQVASGLAAAHKAGIIHRDLKPDNILLEHSSQTVRIGDFGLAKRLTQEHLTGEGKLAGTPSFMSPEQTLRQPLDGRSDLFSLGTVLYAMTTGTLPFSGDDPYIILDAIRSAQAIPPQQIRSEIPDWLSDLILKLLEKTPEKRVVSATELVRILDTHRLEGDHNTHRLLRWAKLWPIPAVIGLLLVGWLSTVHFLSQDKNGNARQTTSKNLPTENNALRANGIATRQAIWNAGTDAEFDSIESAISAAKDGDTIVVGRNIKSNKIDIVGKSLVIQAAPGMRPSVSSMSAITDDNNGWITSDSNLTLSGLDVDWDARSGNPAWDGTKVVAVVLTLSGTSLVVDRCHIQRSSSGITIAVGGNMLLRQSWIEGEEVGVGFSGYESDIQVENSFLDSNTNFGVSYLRTRTTTDRTPSRLKVKSSKCIGTAAVGVFAFWPPETRVEVQLEDCVLDTSATLRLVATNLSLAPDLANADVIQSRAHAWVSWKEIHCKHRSNRDFLIGNKLKNIQRNYLSGLTTIQKWTEFWSKSETPGIVQDPHSGRLHLEKPSIEQGFPWDAP